MNKTIITVVIVAVIILGGYFLLKDKYQPTSAVLPASTQQIVSQPSVDQTPAAKENVVIYTNAGYSPATLKIKKGETVIFKNQSSQSMWTASAMHPTHQVYPTTGGCLGSTFDACKGVQPGDSWSFRFDIAGTWKYHNHLPPINTGTILVE